MSLIQYIEPVNVGSFFVGIGMLILICTLANIFFKLYNKLCQLFDIVINRESKYEILEGAFLDKIGKKKGIDLEKELVRRNMFRNSRVRGKSFRKKIEEQVHEEMFGKENSKKKEEEI
jgi:hypothetical protein